MTVGNWQIVPKERALMERSTWTPSLQLLAEMAKLKKIGERRVATIRTAQLQFVCWLLNVPATG